MKKFLKSDQVELVSGYLAVKGAEVMTPVTHKAFVKAQQHAEYIITFAKLAKDKDFVGKKADSLSDLVKEVKEALAEKAKTYVAKPEKIEKPITKSLADEAMAFMKFEETTTKVEKMNAFLQQFNIVSEFEEIGLFFKEGIVRLNKIYTIAEITEAVKQTIDLLD